MSYKKALAPVGIAGPLVFNPWGDVSVTFHMPMHSNDYRDDEGRVGHWGRLRMCLAMLPGSAVLQYVPRQVPVAAVIARGLEAVPEGRTIEELPELEEQIDNDARWVSQLAEPPQEDMAILTVRLGDVGSFTSGNATRPSRARLKKAAQAASEVLDKVRSFFPGASPVTAGFLRWFYQYAAAFGGVEPPYTLDDYQEAGSTDFVATLRPLLACALNEAAIERPRGLSKHALRNAVSGWMSLETPLVSDPAAPFPALLPNGDPFPATQVGFQATMIMHENADVADYPDDCLNDRIKSSLDFPVRIAALSRSVSDKDTLRKLNDIFKQLTYAMDQARDDSASNTELETAWDTAHELYDELLQSRSVRMPTTVLLTVGAATREQLELRVSLLNDLINPTGVKVTRPAGKQTELWAAMLPGARTPAFARMYERQLLPDGVAALGLTHGDELGDGYGRVWATRADRPGAARLVYRMITLGIEMRPGVVHGGSVTANLGDQGAGKSMGLKALAKDIFNQGGALGGMDLTPEGELGPFAAALDAKAMIVRFADPKAPVIDPFRVNATDLPSHGELDKIGRPREEALAEAEIQTLTYLGIMLEMSASSMPYKILQRAVATVLDDDFPLERSMSSLLTLLMHWAGDARAPSVEDDDGVAHPSFAPEAAAYRKAAQELVLDLSNLKRRRDVGHQLFGEGEVIDLTKRSLFFVAPNLALTSASDKAYLYLATTYLLRHMSATPTINGLLLPEAHHYQKIPQGVELVNQVTRQSRRRRGVVLMDTHESFDFVDARQINQRTLGRTRDEDACRAGLQWNGLKHPSSALVVTVQNFDPFQGHKFFRDRHSRFGVVSELRMHDETLFQASRTNYASAVQSAPALAGAEL